MDNQNNNPPVPGISPPPSSPTANNASKTVGEEANSNQNEGKDQPPIQTGGLQNFLTSSQGTTSGSQSATGKIIATVLSILIMVGGVFAGVFLVNQQQEIRSRANEQVCLQSDNCVIIESPADSGSYQIEGIIYDVYLTDENANIFGAGVTEDGCYQTVIDGDSLSWERIGPDSECENLVNIQVWMVELPQDTIDPVESQCQNISIYDTGWNLLSNEDLSQLSSGDKIRVAVSSSTTAGTIDQARFTINGQLQDPTTLKKPDSGELYMEYEIPENVEALDISVELYHSTFGWF